MRDSSADAPRDDLDARGELPAPVTVAPRPEFPVSAGKKFILMIGRIGNLVLMGLLPIALTAPLAVSEVDFWFYQVREEISIVGSLTALYESDDMMLFYLILCLSVIGPYLRLVLMSYAAFSSPAMALRIRPFLELVGRFSLIDVIIISLLVISFRVPEFKLQWGFYLVLWLWVLDMIATWSVWNHLIRDAERERRLDEDWLEMEPARTGPRRPDQGQRPAATPSSAPAIAGVEQQGGQASALARAVTDRVLNGAAAVQRGFERLRAASSRPDRSSEPD